MPVSTRGSHNSTKKRHCIAHFNGLVRGFYSDTFKKITMLNTVWYCYNMVDFHQNHHKRHPIVHPWQWDGTSFVSASPGLCSASVLAVLYALTVWRAHSTMEGIKNNGWIAMNNIFFWLRVRWFANDFHLWRSHKWKSLANPIMSDPKKIIIHGNECII